MCGIVGTVRWNTPDPLPADLLDVALAQLQRRGPDAVGTFSDRGIALGHRRLSIIDPSASGHQPFQDQSDRYTIVFNGECYNYREHREALLAQGVTLQSSTDTEVLLHLYMQEGPAFLEKINGFFALAIYDRADRTLFLARDRMGIKPLLYHFESGKFSFASELKALFALGIPKVLDRASLFAYLQLNYVPGPATMLEDVLHLPPGHTLTIDLNSDGTELPEPVAYYSIPYHQEKSIPPTPESYTAAKSRLQEVLEQAVARRLVSDVSLGAFLSGGIDSSVIAALAQRYDNQLHTFSIGYRDEPYFDETHFAEAVAKKIGTYHTVFSLTNDDLFEHLHDALDYFDQPFADSSALAVYVLSQRTRKQVTVALSGDGADEIFSGYNKHAAEFKVRNPGVAEHLVSSMQPLWKAVPQSRQGKLTNLSRQLNKFSEGMKLSPKSRYWRWATLLRSEQANYLLKEHIVFNPQRLTDDAYRYKKRRDQLLKSISPEGNINEVLLTDSRMVLVYDMLQKVDAMSMANSLEVRTPFLDHEVVNFAFSLPPAFKINASMRKKILQDTFRDLLPTELYNRPKHGFEVPLLNWFRTDLRSMITDDLLAPEFLQAQGLFNTEGVGELLKRLFSKNPGDAAATVWALIVFQHWWKKYMLD